MPRRVRIPHAPHHPFHTTPCHADLSVGEEPPALFGLNGLGDHVQIHTHAHTRAHTHTRTLSKTFHFKRPKVQWTRLALLPRNAFFFFLDLPVHSAVGGQLFVLCLSAQPRTARRHERPVCVPRGLGHHTHPHTHAHARTRTCAYAHARAHAKHILQYTNASATLPIRFRLALTPRTRP